MDLHTEIENLERAIAALEAQRHTVGDQATDLAVASIREKLAALRASTHAGQRKLVTVLFADLADHTALFARLDSEDVRELTGRYFAEWKDSLESHGGVVEKFIGDAVMAVFGLRLAREDDPQQAILSALEMRHRLEALNETIEQERGVRLSMRVGIHTGEVVVSRTAGRPGEDFGVVGETVNLASRLQAAAPPGEILISHDTYRLVLGVFNVRKLDPVRVKGVDRPLQVYLVGSAKRRAFRMATRGVEGVETRMIGREGDLKRLQDAFWEAVEDRERQVITIVGEAGIGKSRLIYEFDHWLELLPESVYYFKGRAYPSAQNSPYSLLRSVFAFRFEIHDSDPPQRVWDKLEQGVREVLGGGEDSSRQAYYIGRLLGFELGASPYRPETGDEARQFHEQALVYLRDYFRTLAAHHPVAVLLEDIHWADNSSLDLLHRLEGALAGQPILVVCTARTGLFVRRPNWGEGLPFHHRLDLRPLTKRESRRLVEEILQNLGAVPHELRDLVLQKAEGNPFYIEEGIKMLVDEGVIEISTAGWRVYLDQLPEVKIPPTLAGVLQARLDSLDPREQRVLQRAAVFGRVFWDQAVDYLRSPQNGEKLDADVPVRELLAGLRAREIVFQRERSSFDATREYLFKHSLFRDVTYEGLLKRQRRVYHARAARWLEQATQRSERADEYAALIALHYEQAGEPGLASVWYRRTGVHAAARFANEEAVDAYSRALQLAPQGDERGMLEILLGRERVFDLLGARQEQAADLQEISRLARLSGDELSLAEAALRHANFAFSTGDYPAAITAAQQAAALGQRAGLIEKEAQGYFLWARAMDFQRARPEALEKFERALELARAADLPRLEAEILMSLGPHFSDLNDYPEARKHLQAALQVYRDLGDRHGEAKALGNLGVTSWGQGNQAEAKRCFEAALQAIREVGDRRVEGILVGNLGVIAYELLDYCEALRWHRQALEIAQQVADKHSQCVDFGNLAEAGRDLGDFEGAQANFDQSLQLAREIGNLQNQSAVLQGMSRLVEYQGDGAAALEYAQQALALAREAKSTLYEAISLSRLGQALLRAGRHSEAAVHFQRALELKRDLGLESQAVESTAGLARAALAGGDTGTALRFVEQILQHLETQNLLGTEEPVQVYLTCCQVLNAAGDPRAKSVLEAGYRFLEELAARIEDERLRRSFLERVPANRKLVEFWKGAQTI